MSKHTEGPWKPLLFNPPTKKDNWHAIRGPEGQIIAILDADYYDDIEELTANAHLICAAPDLLKAGRWLMHLAHGVSRDGSGHITDGEWRDAQDAMVEAIAKAKEGENE